MESVGRGRVVLTGLALATFASITAETMPIGLLPSIARGFGVPAQSVGALVGAYALVVVVATIPLARLTHRVPRRLLISVVLAVFVLGTAVSALAPGYWPLLAGRVLTALAHSVFWAIVVPIAASVAPPEARGRAVSTVYAGGSVATVLGVPFATWLGQVADWRLAFATVSALGAVALVVVGASVREGARERASAAGGASPDRGRYVRLVLLAALCATGAMAAFTYVSPFLTGVAELPAVAVGGLLLVRGVVGLAAVLVVGRSVDRFPGATLPVAIGVQVLGLLLQSATALVPALGVVGVVLAGAGLAAFSSALGARVLVVAPTSVEVASAGTSTAFNVGFAAGAAVGGVALGSVGVAGLPTVGLLLAVVALVLAVAPTRIRR